MNALLANQGYASEETTNKAWADDTSSFGQRMLMKMGWKAGKGLGKDETGMTEHVKVVKKIDDRGLGADADPLGEGNTKWAEQQQSFSGVLAALNEKYGASANSRASAPEKKERRKRKTVEGNETPTVEDKREVVDPKKESKKRKKASLQSPENSQKGSDHNNAGDDERSVVDLGRGAAESKSERKARRAAKRAKKEAKAVRKEEKAKKTGTRNLTVRDLSRARFIRSKNVGGYSSKDLAAVLGVVPAASPAVATNA